MLTVEPDQTRADRRVDLGQVGADLACVGDVLSGAGAALERESALRPEVHRQMSTPLKY